MSFGAHFLCYDIAMISKRARIVKKLLKAGMNKHAYSNANIQRHRKKFDNNLKILFLEHTSRHSSRQIIAGIPTYWFYPEQKTNRTIFYVHGGGFIFGSPLTHAQHTARLAKACKATVISVEYSLAPEQVFPAALHELQKVWQALAGTTIDPNSTVIMGDSAGGNLALALSLSIRDEGLPSPGCIVLLSPALDAHFSGQSYITNAERDPVLTQEKIDFFLNAYIGEESKHNPLVAPVHATLEGLPPMLIQVGTDEILLSDSETIQHNATRDGAEVTLDIAEGMWHGYQLFASYIPESKHAITRIAKFLDKYI